MRQGETLVPKPTVFYSFRISGTRHITKTVKTTHRKHRKPPTVSPDRPLPEHRQTHFSPKPYSMKIKKHHYPHPDKSPMVISMNRTEPPPCRASSFPTSSTTLQANDNSCMPLIIMVHRLFYPCSCYGHLSHGNTGIVTRDGSWQIGL